MNAQEPNLMDFLLVIWKRKWQIVLPTFALVVLAGVASFFMPRKYEVDAIIRPSMIFVQNQQGNFQEVVVVDPKQVAGQINQKSYDRLIAAQLKIDISDFPRLDAENIRDTQLVRVSLEDKDIARAKAVLTALFSILEKDFNTKIEVEIKALDSQIKADEFEIGKKNLDIKSREIEQDKNREEIASAKNRLTISEDKYKSIADEMASVKKRIDSLEAQQREVLKQPAEGATAISLLLYSSEVQQNLRYYNDLDEKLSVEKMAQEDFKLAAKSAEQQIKQLGTEIDRLKTEIQSLQNSISLLSEKKARIDYARLVKDPTASIHPVSPRKPFILAVAGFIGLLLFTPLAFLMEYVEIQKSAPNSPR
jgi:LPS O-antigen subunit length determinant protein (WzzB/FepE family)